MCSLYMLLLGSVFEFTPVKVLKTKIEKRGLLVKCRRAFGVVD